MVACVIVDHHSKHVDRAFDYNIPQELEGKIDTGSRVIVPFSKGNFQCEGFCTEIKAEAETSKLKSIIRLASAEKAFDKNMLETIEYMHKRYFTPYIDIIHAVVPSGTETKSVEWIIIGEVTEERSEVRKRILEILFSEGGEMEFSLLRSMFDTDIRTRVTDMIKKGTLRKEFRSSRSIKSRTYKAVRLSVSIESAEEAAIKAEKKAPVRAKILRMLCETEFLALSEMKNLSGGAANAVTLLVKQGLAEMFDAESERDPFEGRKIVTAEAPDLTEEQQTAVNAINSASDGKKYRPFLIRGVTGSGKTEVFIKVIEHVTERGMSALVLVPEISLTPQMISRFLARFRSGVAVLHSGLSLGERYDQWKRIMNSDANIVIGARSAVFAPIKNIGAIIVDEEHSDTYKSEMSPRYHAKEIAAQRAEQSGAVLVLASATPSVESYYKAQHGEYTLLEMKNRINNREMPEIMVADMREELANGNRSMFSKALTDEIKENIKNREQTILFLNRRGYSTFVSCRSCGYTVQCPNCNISLTYHKFDDKLKCHYCGYEIKNYTVCPECGSKYIRYFGGGTQRVEDEINKIFPAATVIRMDMDTTGRKFSHERILEKFVDEHIDILIGTQMVSKGLDFENVTLVGVISADTMLHMHDYRSPERTFSMIEQVTGRAGRGGKKGRAVVQTYSPEDESIIFASRNDYISFYDTEIKKRELMRYPPFSKMINIIFSGSSQTLVPQTAKYYMKNLECAYRENKEKYGHIQVLGPVPSVISKIKNKYRWHIIIKCYDDDVLNPVLLAAENACLENKNYEGVSVITDKNPNMTD